MFKKHVQWGILFGSLAGAMPVSAEVDIYGLLVPTFDYVQASGGTTSVPSDKPTQINAATYRDITFSQQRINGSVSNIGFRGNDRITDNLEVFWQVENAVSFDNNSALGNWANRNSGAGVRGSFGTLLGGIWDTPYAWSTIGVASPVRNPYSGDFNNIIQNPGFNVPITTTQSGYSGTIADATFGRRQGNSLQYWTPKWYGFSGRFAYSMGSGEVTLKNGAKVDPKVYGASLEYSDANWLIRYAFAQHEDYFGLSWLGAGATANPGTSALSTVTSSRDTANKLLVRYTWDGLKLIGIYENLRYTSNDRTVGNVKMYNRDALYGMIWYTTGPHNVWAGGGVALKGECSAVATSCNTDGLGAKMWQTGYRYDLSKRSDIYAAVYGVHNNSSGNYGVWPRIQSSGVTPAPGMRYLGASLGIETSF